MNIFLVSAFQNTSKSIRNAQRAMELLSIILISMFLLKYVLGGSVVRSVCKYQGQLYLQQKHLKECVSGTILPRVLLPNKDGGRKTFLHFGPGPYKKSKPIIIGKNYRNLF